MAGVAMDIEAALEQSIIAAVLIDERDHVLFFNQAAERLWGYAREEILGRHMMPLLPAALREVHGGYTHHNRAGGEPKVVGINREIPLERKDGRRVWTTFALSRIDIEGRIHYLALIRDIDEEVARREENRLLLLAINHTSQPMLILDESRRIVQVNRAFTYLFGYGAEEAVGHSPTQLLACSDTDRTVLERLRRKKWEAEYEFHEELLAGCKNGREVWVRTTVNSVRGEEDGRVRNLVMSISDVTEERQIRDLERDVLRALTSDLSFEEVGDFLCRRIEAIVPGVITTVGRIEDRRIRPWASPFFPQEYADTWNGVEIGEGVASCGTTAHRGEPVMVYDIDTDPLWKPYKHLILPYDLRACWTYPVKRGDGSVAGTFGFYFREGGESDAFLERVAETSVHLCTLAIEREENRLRLARLVRFDTLTGLPNRLHLDHHLDELLSGTTREISCFSLGLDRFKDINATLGHAAGDQTLVTMANRLQKRLVPGQYVARPEGDLFLVVAPDCGVRGASLLAERLLRVVAEPIEIGGHQLSLSASVGISHFPKSGEERDGLIANAKHAMYRAKEAGGETYRFFSLEMNEMAQDRLLLGTALKRAIGAGGLRLHYQPQVDTDSGRLHGFEALARWHDEAYGEIPPARFIALAEETGQIEAVSRWVLREACRQLSEWRKAGMQVPTVSVNLSPVNFQDPRLPGLVAGLLEAFELPGDSLTIEITESTMVSLTDEMLRVVHGLLELGVKLSVDDFGTGFSSLSNLINLPVTEVKIDRSFIAKVLEEERTRSLVAAVVGMGNSLNLTVVAEGVETHQQRALLKQFRCPVLQGYLFSPPLNPVDAMAWAKGEAAACR